MLELAITFLQQTFSQPRPSFFYVFVQLSLSDLQRLRPLCGEARPRAEIRTRDGRIWDTNY